MLAHAGARRNGVQTPWLTVPAVLDDRDPGRERRRREWADWSAHGYGKLYTPRSMLLFGGIFFTLFAVGLVIMFWLAANGRLP